MARWLLVNPFQSIYVGQDGQATRDSKEAARFACKEDAETFNDRREKARYFVTREYEDLPPLAK